jgi:hypothetical protein
MGRRAPLIFNLGFRRGWVIIATSRSTYLRERPSVPTVKEARWAPELVWKGVKKIAFLSPYRDSNTEAPSP